MCMLCDCYLDFVGIRSVFCENRLATLLISESFKHIGLKLDEKVPQLTFLCPTFDTVTLHYAADLGSLFNCFVTHHLFVL